MPQPFDRTYSRRADVCDDHDVVIQFLERLRGLRARIRQIEAFRKAADADGIYICDEHGDYRLPINDQTMIPALLDEQYAAVASLLAASEACIKRMAAAIKETA